MQELGGWIPLDQCLSEARAAGFEGMELGNKFPRQAALLKPILDRHNLVLVGGWHSIFLLERDAETEFKEAAVHRQLLKDMGVNIFIVAECAGAVHGDKTKPLSARPVMTAGQWHAFNWGGFDPALYAKKYKNRIRHVHAKDVRAAVREKAEKHDWPFLNAVVAGVYTVPGDGMVDYLSVFRELVGYSGWAVVEAEQDPEKAPPAKYAKMGYDNLVGFLKASGMM
jgi:sugar phosphate isomerase/epimerase